MENIISKLKDTQSRLEKEAILSDNKDNIVLQKILKWTYDPSIVFHIKKCPEAFLGLCSFDERFITIEALLESLSAGILSGNEAQRKIESIKSQLNKSAQELLDSIIKKDLRCGISLKTIATVFGDDFIKVFQCQLANKWDENKNYKNTEWYITPKLDGIRGVFYQGKFLSRNGKVLKGFEHIEKELKQVADGFNLELIDGELFSKEIPFQEIQGIVMSSVNIDEEKKRMIKFNIFAVKPYGVEINSEEMNNLIAKINQYDATYLELIGAVNINVNTRENKESIKRIALRFIEKGYEGIMLRNAEKSYHFGRSDDLLKVKFMKDTSLREDDFIIIGFNEGEGRNKGRLGAIVCKGIVEGQEVSANVGSGYKDWQREEIWKNKEKYLGKEVSIIYQNLTDDKTSLRFPIFHGLKLDR